jgi:hypothetical protein
MTAMYALHDDQYTLSIASRSVLLKIRNFLGKHSREKQNTHFMVSNCFSFFFFFEIRAVYKIPCKTTVQPDWPQKTIRRMRIACWIPKATNALGICNTYSVSTATVIHGSTSTWRSYAHRLYCSRKFEFQTADLCVLKCGVAYLFPMVFSH